MSTQMALTASQRPCSALEASIGCSDPCEAAETPLALRDAAATLDYVARLLARLLPAGQTDVRADIAMLRMVADNVRGYAQSREAA